MKAGYGGPFQSSGTIMMMCYFNCTLFNSTPLAYYVYIYIYTHIHIYIYRDGERDIEREIYRNAALLGGVRGGGPDVGGRDGARHQQAPRSDPWGGEETVNYMVVDVYIHIYIYIYVHVICIYIYILEILICIYIYI